MPGGGGRDGHADGVSTASPPSPASAGKLPNRLGRLPAGGELSGLAEGGREVGQVLRHRAEGEEPAARASQFAGCGIERGVGASHAVPVAEGEGRSGGEALILQG
ncbi:hypothetical protein GCM10027073_38590 [Streptomyces chlorus]